MKKHTSNRGKRFLFLFGIQLVLVVILCSSMLAQAKAKPKIIIGDDINYPPYSFQDRNGNATGFNVELAKAAAAAMGYDVEIRLDEWGRTRKALETGKIDAVSGMFYSKLRESVYSYTVKHYITSGDVFTRKGITITSEEDLRGKTVLVQNSDILGEYLQGLQMQINLVEVATPEEALTLVENNKYDYAVLMKQIGLYSIQKGNHKDIKVQDIVMNPQQCAIAVKKGNDTLLMLLNGGLNILKANGTYQRIYNKWLGVYDKKDIFDYLLKYSWIIILLGFAFLLLVFISIMLKRLVDKRTIELKQANKILESKHNELSKVNHELKESEEKNNAILNALPDMLFMINEEGVFIDCHVSDKKQLLMPTEAFIGKKLKDVLPEDIAINGLAYVKQAIQSGSLKRYEYETTLDDTRQVFEMRIVRLRDHEAVCIARNISKDKFYKEEIEYLNYHDHLTGLYNRRYFEEELKRLDTKRNLPLCVIMGDVNGLKLINDSFGHEIGDKLLIKVAEVLRKACRSDEIISRIGGDEFVILIPSIDNLHVEMLIERIHEISVNEKVQAVDLSISFGWEIKYYQDEDIHEVFKRAEDFMYKKKLFEGPSVRGRTIGAIVQTLYEKNKREEQHSICVSDLCRRLAIAMGMRETEVEVIKTTGLLHDIGKIAINEEILNSNIKLTAEEYEEIKRHTEVGYRILNSVNDMHDIAEYVLYHHERWDGTGYPRGLKGAEIPVQSRMISIADAFDAITSDRNFRVKQSEEFAIQELQRNSGLQFDPVLVDIFINQVVGSEMAEGVEERDELS